VSPNLVDWALAERIAAAVGSRGRDGASPPALGRDPFAAAAVEAACSRATDEVIAYTGLRPATPPPHPEPVGRTAWAANALALLRELGGELDQRAAGAIDAPGGFGRLARPAVGVGLAAEAGAVAGYASRKVLGQYDISLIDPERPPRLLFVVPNLRVAQVQLDADPAIFLHWVALHETTHAVQFAAVPWLREHVADLVRRLVGGAADWVQSGGLRQAAARLARSDPRRLGGAILRGELARALANPEQGPLVDGLQATMAVIEGHAEHVMDAAAADRGGEHAVLRERLEARRRSRTGLDALVGRLLGLDLKLRQYRLGKGFCDSITEAAGVDGLNRVWQSPDALPDLGELERPREWMARVELVQATA
jgi:coenzyme F420 biosynthesis associated uncharacterized protein